MNIRDATFDLDDIERYGMGAGVIPVAIHPETKEAHLLLGRERWMPTWKGSCRWSGFEGSRKEGETMTETSLREFLEESLGVVNTGKRNMRERLIIQEYWFRIVLRIENDRKPERYHTTFVVHVEWDSLVHERFQELRSNIEHVDRLSQEWRHTRPAILGDIGEDIGDITTNANGEICIRKRAASSPCILRSPWTTDPENSKLVMAILTDTYMSNAVCAWITLRERLGRSIVSHPCIRVRRDCLWNNIQDVNIQRDYIEKDQIRWWSLTDLVAVIEGRGQLGVDRFRPYFLPVLQTVLKQLNAPLPEMPQSVSVCQEAIDESPELTEQSPS